LALTSEALSKVSGGQAWCQALYSMITAVGVMSMLSSSLGPFSIAQAKHKAGIRIGLCLGTSIACLLISLSCTVHTDLTVLSLISKWGIYFPSFLLLTVCSVTLILAYGLTRATDRIAAQDGHKMHLVLLRYLQVTVRMTPLPLIFFSFSYLPTNNTATNTESLWLKSLGCFLTLAIICQVFAGVVFAVVLSLKSSSYRYLSWKQLLGSTSLRSSRIKLVSRSSRLSSSSYRNFKMSEIPSSSDLGTPSRLRPNKRVGLVNRRLSLSPVRGEDNL